MIECVKASSIEMTGAVKQIPRLKKEMGRSILASCVQTDAVKVY